MLRFAGRVLETVREQVTLTAAPGAGRGRGRGQPDENAGVLAFLNRPAAGGNVVLKPAAGLPSLPTLPGLPAGGQQTPQPAMGQQMGMGQVPIWNLREFASLYCREFAKLHPYFKRCASGSEALSRKALSQIVISPR